MCGQKARYQPDWRRARAPHGPRVWTCHRRQDGTKTGEIRLVAWRRARRLLAGGAFLHLQFFGTSGPGVGHLQEFRSVFARAELCQPAALLRVFPVLGRVLHGTSLRSLIVKGANGTSMGKVPGSELIKLLRFVGTRKLYRRELPLRPSEGASLPFASASRDSACSASLSHDSAMATSRARSVGFLMSWTMRRHSPARRL